MREKRRKATHWLTMTYSIIVFGHERSINPKHTLYLFGDDHIWNECGTGAWKYCQVTCQSSNFLKDKEASSENSPAAIVSFIVSGCHISAASDVWYTRWSPILYKESRLGKEGVLWVIDKLDLFSGWLTSAIDPNESELFWQQHCAPRVHIHVRSFLCSLWWLTWITITHFIHRTIDDPVTFCDLYYKICDAGNNVLK